DYRFEARVGRLKPYRAALPVEPFDRRFTAVDQRYHGLPVVRGLSRFDDDQIRIADVIPDHRIAANAQREGSAAADHIAGHVDRFGIEHRLDRVTGRDHSQQRQLVLAAIDVLAYHLYAAAHIRDAADQPFRLERRDNLMNARGRFQAEPVPYLGQ